MRTGAASPWTLLSCPPFVQWLSDFHTSTREEVLLLLSGCIRIHCDSFAIRVTAVQSIGAL